MFENVSSRVVDTIAFEDDVRATVFVIDGKGKFSGSVSCRLTGNAVVEIGVADMSVNVFNAVEMGTGREIQIVMSGEQTDGKAYFRPVTSLENVRWTRCACVVHGGRDALSAAIAEAMMAFAESGAFTNE